MVAFSRTCRLCVVTVLLPCPLLSNFASFTKAPGAGSPPAALWYQFRLAAHALGPDLVPPCFVLLHIKVNQAILNLRDQSALRMSACESSAHRALSSNTRAAEPVPDLEGCG